MSCPFATNPFSTTPSSQGNSHGSEEEDPTSLSAKERQEIVWKHLLQQQEQGAGELSASCNASRTTWPTYEKVLSDIASADYHHTLTCPLDLIRPSSSSQQRQQQVSGPEKSLCPHGVVCCVRLELFPYPNGRHDTNDRPYTGLLTPGTTHEYGLLRLSSALQPPRESLNGFWARSVLHALTSHKMRHAQLFPCAALKIWSTRGDDDDNTAVVRSSNLLFGGSKIGQRETDYFAHCQCTSMTEKMPRAIKPFVRKFWQYSDYPLSLGVSEFCSNGTTNGQVNDDDESVNFPFAVILKPCINMESSIFAASTTDKDVDDTTTTITTSATTAFDQFVHKALQIPAGTVLYDVYACPDPSAAADPSRLQRIGRLQTTSPMIPSTPHDGLFFRHQKKEDDYRLRPTWPDALRNTTITMDSGKTKGTVGSLAGWKLFEQHIAEGIYVDFEKQGN